MDASSSTDRADQDVIIIGAGFGGLNMLHFARQAGLSGKIIEKASGVGGTWYWNRYPGARSDSEIHSYTFSDRVSEEMLQEWTWSERFARQSEIREYLEYATDKLDLRRDIEFDTTVVSAIWDDEAELWRVTTDDGTEQSAHYLITAVGNVSKTYVPPIPGLDRYEGDIYHTGEWLEDGFDFTGKRVAVIGTGSSGVQVIPEIAPQADQVWVFQRTANYALPARNYTVDPEFDQKIKDEYNELWEKMRHAGFGLYFEHEDRDSLLNFSPEERQRIFEEEWAKGGFRIGLGTPFNDLLANPEANDEVTEFVRGKLSEIIKDPEVREFAVPTDHRFFTKRPPLEFGYYEALERSNVGLVNLRKEPIEAILPNGLRTNDREFEVDAIIFATGFDASTGALFNLGIKGRGGQSLEEAWGDGPATAYGLATQGFPNMFMITGPQSPSSMANLPTAIEQNAEWITALITHMQEQGATIVEPTNEGQEKWGEHHQEMANATLFLETNSWWVGANIPGKVRTLYPYVGGVGGYRGQCEEEATEGYPSFRLEAGRNSEVEAPA